MLDKRLNNTEPAPARRVLRFFALDKGRNNKESVTSKDLQPKEPEERKHEFATWYIFAAFLGVMLIQYLMDPIHTGRDNSVQPIRAIAR